MSDSDERTRGRARRLARRTLITLERRWDAARLARRVDRPPKHFRIVGFGGHGGRGGIAVRGRVLDNPEPPAATEEEGVWSALRRTAERLMTIELPRVPLLVRVGSTRVGAVSDEEGYFVVRFDATPAVGAGPWMVAHVELAGPYRGLTAPRTVATQLRIPDPGAAFGIISDIDDTVLHTGVQRFATAAVRTVTGTALTRTPLAGAPELYRALAGGQEDTANPVFYVSSSPWNLYDFLTAFIDHHGFPAGPLFLRDFLGADERRSHATTKHAVITEILELHPTLPFVLIGDSGQDDPKIYAEVIRRHPDRILAAYIREVRLDPGDGRVEAITDTWGEAVPLVLAADSAAMADHAADLNLVTAADAVAVRLATAKR